MMYSAFNHGGKLDIQRTHPDRNGNIVSTVSGNGFVAMYQDAASFFLGMVGGLTPYGTNFTQFAGSTFAESREKSQFSRSPAVSPKMAVQPT
jgi:hypothetical protein